jgi:hypothetical protein
VELNPAGFVAYRALGSRFIDVLHMKLGDYAYKHDIEKIATIVIKLVAREKYNVENHPDGIETHQVPTVMQTKQTNQTTRIHTKPEIWSSFEFLTKLYIKVC